LIDPLVGDREQFRELLARIDGFVACFLIRTADGGASVSVYAREAGTAASTKGAAAYVDDHHPGVAVEPPHVIEARLLSTATRRPTVSRSSGVGDGR
jgi:hypothetical protein